MSSAARRGDAARSLPWYVTKDLAALGLVTVIAVTGITVLTVWPEPVRHRTEQQVALSSTSSASSTQPPPEVRARTELAAVVATGVTVTSRVLATGGGSGSVSGMSNSGLAVGTVTSGGTTRAVRWTAGTAQPLPASASAPPAQARTVTPAIGEDGEIAYTTSRGSRPAVLTGSKASTSDHLTHGRVLAVDASGQVLITQVSGVAIWDPGLGTITSPLLPTPTGWTAKVSGGHSRDRIAGQVLTGAGTAHAAIWKQGRLQLLPGLGGGTAIAKDTNDSGVSVGTAQAPNGHTHAMRWRDSASGVSGEDLGTVGGTSSQAVGVGDDGAAAGWSTTRAGVEHAVVWLADGRVVDLGQKLGAGVRSRAAGICGDRVYGTRIAADGRTTPVVWTLTRG